MGFLGGIGDMLFGSEPETEVSQHPTLAPWQQELQESPWGEYVKEDAPGYPGKLSADSSNLWQMSLSGLEGLMGAGPTSLSNLIQQTLSSAMTRGPEDYDKYFTESIEKPALKSYKEDVMPAISREYAPSGFWSSQRLEQEEKSSEDLLGFLTEERAKTGYEARESDLNRQLAAVGLAPGAGDFLLKMLSAGGAETAREQGDLDRSYSEWQRQQGDEENRMRMILAALGITAAENVVTQSEGSEGLFGSLLPMAGQAAGAFVGTEAGSAWLAAAMVSSRDYKYNIEEIDSDTEKRLLDLVKNLPIYTWKYKGEGDETKSHLGPVTEESPTEIVTADGKALDTISYMGLLALTVKLLANKVERLERR